MIGDSKVDVETARNAGAWSVGCAFGFGPQNILTHSRRARRQRRRMDAGPNPSVNHTKLRC
ncbi:MAG: hypothetical protein WDM87_02750 [Terracidiphilus sp.]